MTTHALGAAWVYTRSGSVWTQQGSKLVGTGAGWAALPRLLRRAVRQRQHRIVGGPADNSDTGAAWVFVRLTETTAKTGDG